MSCSNFYQKILTTEVDIKKEGKPKLTVLFDILYERPANCNFLIYASLYSDWLKHLHRLEPK